MQKVCLRSNNNDYFFYKDKDEKEMNHLKFLAAFSSFSYSSGCGVIAALRLHFVYCKD